MTPRDEVSLTDSVAAKVVEYLDATPDWTAQGVAEIAEQHLANAKADLQAEPPVEIRVGDLSVFASPDVVPRVTTAVLRVLREYGAKL